MTNQSQIRIEKIKRGPLNIDHFQLYDTNAKSLPLGGDLRSRQGSESDNYPAHHSHLHLWLKRAAGLFSQIIAYIDPPFEMWEGCQWNYSSIVCLGPDQINIVLRSSACCNQTKILFVLDAICGYLFSKQLVNVVKIGTESHDHHKRG